MDEEDQGSLLSDPLLQRLFRLFILFSDITEAGKQRITPEQAHFIIHQFFRINRRDDVQNNIPVTSIGNDPVAFRDLIRICDLLFTSRKQFEPIVDRVFERFVSQVIYKGFLQCKKFGHAKGCVQKRRKWRTYWCTLSPGTVFLWPMHKATTIVNRKVVALDQNSSVHMGTFEDERFTWQLNCSENKFIFAHFDELRRTQWMSEMQMALERRTKSDLLEYDRECSKRPENLICSEKNLTWRLALESENSRLMKLLDEERRALHDEEIVRTLAARMLDEEREKREKLEKKLNDIECSLQKQKNVENCDCKESMTHDCKDEKQSYVIISNQTAQSA